MLELKDIERLNCFNFLRPFEARIREVFQKEGTAATRKFIKRQYRISLQGKEIREFLDAEKLTRKKTKYSRDTHRMAWHNAGWNGQYSPLGYSSGDNMRTKLLASGLVTPNEKILIIT